MVLFPALWSPSWPTTTAATSPCSARPRGPAWSVRRASNTSRFSTASPRSPTRPATTPLFEYDANGNLERQIDPENGPATPARVSTWDSRGLELTRTDANGNSTTWTYDAKGNQETETDGEGSITSITRDGAGRITEHTEGMGTIEARSVSLSYDDMNRIESVVDANGGETTFDYDKAGNRIAMNLPGFPAETRGYDEMNRVVHFDSPAGR